MGLVSGFKVIPKIDTVYVKRHLRVKVGSIERSLN
jgi:hypothetical protein